MHKCLLFLIAVISLLLVGCGSSTQEDFANRVGHAMRAPANDPTTASSLGSLRRVAMSAETTTDTTSITPDQLFDWAEATYPSLFPSRRVSRDWQNYRYRYYEKTDLFLAVEAGATVLALGTPTNGQVVSLGDLSGFQSTVVAARRPECIARYALDTTSSAFLALPDSGTMNKDVAFAKGFSDKKFFVDIHPWNHQNLAIKATMEGCVDRDVFSGAYSFDVECCKGGSHLAPYVAYGWDDVLHAFNPAFAYMSEGPLGANRPAAGLELPMRFDALPRRLWLDYYLSFSNENGYWHITTGLWAYALRPDRVWDCCGHKPQPMDISFWGTKELRETAPSSFEHSYTDINGRTWKLARVKYWDCDGKCPSYDYSVSILLVDGKHRDQVDLVPILNKVVELGWVKSTYGLKNLNIGTEVLHGKVDVKINRFTVIAER